MVLVLCRRRSERRRAPPAPTHEKEREANERSTRGSEKEEAEEDPDTEQRHPQRCLHGTHADPFWADSGHLTPLPYAPLSWALARLAGRDQRGRWAARFTFPRHRPKSRAQRRYWVSTRVSCCARFATTSDGSHPRLAPSQG